MTPQPSALAAFLREFGKSSIDFLQGDFRAMDDLVRGVEIEFSDGSPAVALSSIVGPTQAHGIVTKDMAHHALEVFAEYPEDEPGVDAMFAALESVITHPSPSTAATRTSKSPVGPMHPEPDDVTRCNKCGANLPKHVEGCVELLATTHYFPSSCDMAMRAALREALRVMEMAQVYVGIEGSNEEHDELYQAIESARTLLAGDKT